MNIKVIEKIKKEIQLRSKNMEYSMQVLQTPNIKTSVPPDEDLMTVLRSWYNSINSLDVDTLEHLHYSPSYHQSHYNSVTKYWQTLRHLVLIELKDKISSALREITAKRLPRYAVSICSFKFIKNTNPVEDLICLNTREFQTNLSLATRLPGKVLVLLELKRKSENLAPYRWTGIANIGPDGTISSIKIHKSEYKNFYFRLNLKLQVSLLAALTPAERSFQACHSKDKPDYMQTIISGKVSQFRIENPNEQYQTEIKQVNSSLNKHQLQAAASFLELQAGLHLLWGPPGTGKSTTITTILKALYNREQRSVVATHSNKAVAVLVSRFTRKYPTVPVIVISQIDSNDPNLKRFQFSKWNETNREILKDLKDQILALSELAGQTQNNKKLYKDELRIIARRLQRTMMTVCSFNPALNPYKPYMRQQIKTILQLLNTSHNITSDITSSPFNKLIASIENCIKNITLSKKDLLQKSAVVFGTLSAFGKTIQSNKHSYSITTLLGQFEAIIVDEAGQTTEADIQTVFNTKHKKSLLVGDPKQLPPTIISREAEENRFSLSMMARLMGINWSLAYMLEEQFRMAPEISYFPNLSFYNNQLKNSDSVQQDHPLRRIEPPYYQVIDIEGDEIRQRDGSYANQKEAQAVVQYISRLYRQFRVPANEISVITPYRGQLELIRKIAQDNQVDLTGLHLLNTVDASQGDESGIVLISLVRANINFNIGFLANENRLNVALTRAQHSLRIMCNASTFDPFRPRNPFQNKILHILNALIPTKWDMGVSYSMEPRNLPLVLSTSIAEQKLLDCINERHIRQNEILQASRYGSFQTDYSHRSNLELSRPPPSWKEQTNTWGYDYDDDELDTEINVATNDYFTLFEEIMDTGKSPKIGQYSLFWHAKLPRQTFGMQLLLDKMTNCRKLSLAGIPEDTFAPIKYQQKEGVRVFNRWHNQSETLKAVEKYGEDVLIMERTRADGYPKWLEIKFMVSENLKFEGHDFSEGCIKGVNFYDSEFSDCKFRKTDVRGAKVNLNQMDEVSRESFLKAKKWSENTLGHKPPKKMPAVSQLILDAQKRDLLMTPQPN